MCMKIKTLKLQNGTEEQRDYPFKEALPSEQAVVLRASMTTLLPHFPFRTYVCSNAAQSAIHRHKNSTIYISRRRLKTCTQG